MIDAIVALAIRHRTLVLVGALALCVGGAIRTSSIPVDVFPDISAPRVAIVTEAPGLPAVEVEQLVTYPLEAAVHGASGVRRMRSVSAAGMSIVWLDFDWETPTWLARQRVTERLSAATLPPQADSPFLAPASSFMAEIMFVAIVADGRESNSMEMRRVAELTVRRRLLATPGVAEVTVIGGHEREYQVLVDPARLDAHQLTADAVAQAIERGTQNAGGGWVVERGIESVVRILGRADSVEEIGAISIQTVDGVPLYLRDVATVRVGKAVRRGTGGYDGESAVVLGVMKQPDADTLTTTAAVDNSLDELDALLSRRGLRIERESFRQSTFIRRATDNLFDVLFDGAILVAIVLILFLWNPSATLISVIALPVSLLTATLALDWLGMSLNTMTLGGLAIAVGELVDDAIVDVENVTRRLRERAQQDPTERASIVATVLKASLEIRSAIVSATVVIALVFVPLLFLSGFEGRLLRPLAIAYLVAIAASLVVALTLTPALCTVLLRRTTSREPPVHARVVRAYQPWLRRALARPRWSVALTTVLMLGGLIGLAMAGRGFLPKFNEGSLNVLMIGVPGTPLEDSDALGQMADRALLNDPAVTHVTRRTGQASRDEHVLGPETNEMEVLLKQDDPRSREQLLEDLRDALNVVPGARPAFGQPISHRIDHMLSGQRSALAVRVVGTDLNRIRRIAEQVRAAMETVEGAVDVQVEPIVDIPHLEIDVDEHAAARYGFSRGQAADAIGTALWGREVGAVLEDGASTPIRLRYPDAVREDRLRLRSALVPTPTGAAVPVEGLSLLREQRSPNYVMRENATRRVLVTANVAGRDEVSFAQATRETIQDAIELPPDVHLEYAGRHEQERAATLRLLLLALLALVGVALVVGITLRSRRRALIVLVNLPLALAGGVVGVYFSGGVMSLATTIGFITLFGIATRNGLLLATRVGDLEREGLLREEAVLQGASERLSPILMTAVTAALGLLPLGLSLGDPGAEIQAPMALVILTGLASSTLLNMFVVPALLARWGEKRVSFAAPSDA